MQLVCYVHVWRVADTYSSNTYADVHPVVMAGAVLHHRSHIAAHDGDTRFWGIAIFASGYCARVQNLFEDLYFILIGLLIPQISLHFPGNNEPQNEQNGQEARKTNAQYVVLPGHPFYGCPVRVLKHTAGYCTIEDPAHPEFRYEMLANWLSPSPPPPQAPSMATHDPIPLALSALDRLVQIIVLKDQATKDSADERANESSRPAHLGSTAIRTQNPVEGPTILSDTEADRREGA